MKEGTVNPAIVNANMGNMVGINISLLQQQIYKRTMNNVNVALTPDGIVIPNSSNSKPPFSP